MYRSILLAATLLALPAAAQPALFVPADGARSSLAARQSELLGHLEAIPAAVETHVVEARPAVLEEAEVLFNLAPGVAATLTRARAERRVGGASYFFESTDDGTFAIVVARNGQLTGSVRVAGVLWALRPLTGGLHAVARMDERRFVDHPPEWDAAEAAHRDDAPGAAAPEPGAPEGSTVVQRILVPYSSTAASQVGDIVALVQLAVDETNQGYANSDVDHRIELTYTYQTSQSQSSNFSTNLDRLADPDDGYYDEVPGLREQYGADMVQMILGEDGSLCGQAYTILAEGPDEAFAVSSQSCATGYYTFGHEFGHLQGARHNPEADGSTFPFPYGHGKYSIAGGWRTIMSYACPGDCTRVLYWSNPDVLYNGESMGDTSRRHNQRVLNETALDVAAFYPDPALGAAAVEATLTGPSVVPANGGPVFFDLTFSNTSGAPFSGEYWVSAQLPNGNPYGPAVGPTALSLANGQTLTVSIQANVPRRAPAGGYTATAYVGTYPSDVDDSDSFTFTKAAPRVGGGDETEHAVWTVAEVLREGNTVSTTAAAATAVAALPAGAALLDVRPNPLAGAASVRYTVPEAAHVRLAVYDVLGREVAVLANGVQEAGSHEATFDAGRLPSGPYLVRLETGGGVLTQRATLLR